MGIGEQTSLVTVQADSKCSTDARDIACRQVRVRPGLVLCARTAEHGSRQDAGIAGVVSANELSSHALVYWPHSRFRVRLNSHTRAR